MDDFPVNGFPTVHALRVNFGMYGGVGGGLGGSTMSRRRYTAWHRMGFTASGSGPEREPGEHHSLTASYNRNTANERTFVGETNCIPLQHICCTYFAGARMHTDTTLVLVLIMCSACMAGRPQYKHYYMAKLEISYNKMKTCTQFNCFALL